MLERANNKFGKVNFKIFILFFLHCFRDVALRYVAGLTGDSMSFR